MVNQFNPLGPLTNTLRQFTEQGNQLVRGLGDTFAQTTNTLLSGAGGALPALPQIRLPGLPALGGAATRGNPNGGGQLNITQALRAPLQAFASIEDVALPQGISGPARLALEATTPTAPTPAMEEVPAAAAVVTPTSLGVEGAAVQGRRRPSRALGIQSV